MSEYDYDLFVIGAGSGGVRASRIAAELGATVAIAESRYLGGTCVNVGCVPKKLFVYASHFAEEFESARGYGWEVEKPQFDWNTLRENKNKEISYLNGVYERILKKSGVTIFNGHARIINPHQIAIGDQTYSARYILIATGGWPYVPQFPGSQLAITSNETFFLPELPKSIVIVGGGYIAVEFAGIFNGLGVETHLPYRGSRLLRHFDEDISKHLYEEMEKKGVHIHLNTDVVEISEVKMAEQSKSLQVQLDSGKVLTVEQVMYATGRKPLLDNLGLESTAVTINERQEIVVDDYFRTEQENIFALGDVKGGIELTPVAIAEGMVLANNLFNPEYKNNPKTMDYSDIPTAIFSQPNVATVGLSEHEGRKRFTKIKIFETNFRDLKQSLAGLGERTYMKLVVDAESDKVIGCHMVGQNAGEIIQGLAVAMKAGATKAHFDQCLGIHPTAAEEFVTMRTAAR